MNKSAVIKKANALVEAGHRLSLSEQRIVLAAIAQIRKDESPDSRKWYYVTAQDLAAAAGIGMQDAYDDLERGADRLWERAVIIRSTPKGGKHAHKGQSVLKARWVQAVHYLSGEGRVALMFSAPVSPYLYQLYKQFTQYKLEYVAPMKSRFGPRLYELLAQWRSIGKREIGVDWLQELWGINYSRVYDLKRRVIEPAVRDVNGYSDLTVSWRQRKTGRRVVAIQFQFESKRKNAAQDKQRISPKLTIQAIEQAARPGESWGDVMARLHQPDR